MLRRRRCLFGIIAAVSFGRRFRSYRNGHVYVRWSGPQLQTGRRKTAASLCSRDQILEGSWEPISLPRTPYVPTSRPLHGRCYRSKGGRGINLSLSAEPFPSYDWVVSSSHDGNANGNKACILSEWSAESFCSALRNRTVAFVGDSMTELQYYSLGYLLGHQPRRPMPHREWKYQSSQDICDGASWMYWRGDPHLMALPGVIREKQPDIVIINRGSHYQSDEETVAGLNGTVIPALREWHRGGNCTRRARVERKDRRCRLFFRTTTPGHPRCGRHTRPLRPRSEEVAAMAVAIGNESEYRREGDFNTYHWQDFRHQNHLQERVLAESGLDFTVLDVYDIMLLRPDLHSDGEPGGNDTDCLHYCLPGPLDLLNRLLLHELLREEKE